MYHCTRITLTDINPHLMCVLCGGYFVDATTIIECLHSFCKTCIVRYLESSKFCPICDVQVHKTRPLLNIRSDKTLQDLVYKLVPGLFDEEMRRRREFLTRHPEAMRPGMDLEQRGRAQLVPAHSLPEERVSLILQLARPNRTTVYGSPMHSPNSTKPSERRYLLCPLGISVSILKRFLRMKFNVSSKFQIDVFYRQRDEPISDDFTLLDITSVYSYNKMQPLRLFYLVYERETMKRKAAEEPVVSHTKAKKRHLVVKRKANLEGKKAAAGKLHHKAGRLVHKGRGRPPLGVSNGGGRGQATHSLAPKGRGRPPHGLQSKGRGRPPLPLPGFERTRKLGGGRAHSPQKAKLTVALQKKRQALKESKKKALKQRNKDAQKESKKKQQMLRVKLPERTRSVSSKKVVTTPGRRASLDDSKKEDESGRKQSNVSVKATSKRMERRESRDSNKSTASNKSSKASSNKKSSSSNWRNSISRREVQSLLDSAPTHRRVSSNSKSTPEKSERSLVNDKDERVKSAGDKSRLTSAGDKSRLTSVNGKPALTMINKDVDKRVKNGRKLLASDSDNKELQLSTSFYSKKTLESPPKAVLSMTNGNKAISQSHNGRNDNTIGAKNCDGDKKNDEDLGENYVKKEQTCQNTETRESSCQTPLAKDLSTKPSKDSSDKNPKDSTFLGVVRDKVWQLKQEEVSRPSSPKQRSSSPDSSRSASPNLHPFSVGRGSHNTSRSNSPKTTPTVKKGSRSNSPKLTAKLKTDSRSNSPKLVNGRDSSRSGSGFGDNKPTRSSRHNSGDSSNSSTRKTSVSSMSADLVLRLEPLPEKISVDVTHSSSSEASSDVTSPGAEDRSHSTGDELVGDFKGGGLENHTRHHVCNVSTFSTSPHVALTQLSIDVGGRIQGRANGGDKRESKELTTLGRCSPVPTSKNDNATTTKKR